MQASSIHMMNMCEAFSELGHEVQLICPDHGKNEKEIFDFYGTKSKFSIKFQSYPRFKGKTLFFLLSSVKALLEFKPDLVVSRFGLGSLLSSLLGFPVIHDLHGSVWEEGALNSFVFRNLFLRKKLVKLTFNSNALKELFLQRSFKHSCQLQVLHNGSKMVNLDEKVSLPGKNSIKAGYLGNLYKGRGIELILNLAKALPQVDFIIVGGKAEDILQYSDCSLPNLFFLGFIEPASVFKYRNSVDILLAPYMNTVTLAGNQGNSVAYMNPVKLIEYMASKKIILCSDLPAIREVLDESQAILLNTSDEQKWIDAIKAIVANQGDFSHLAVNSYTNFKNKFTWTSRAARMIDLS
jgi:glycosyltransferase involved in cell wall biosynthesis